MSDQNPRDSLPNSGPDALIRLVQTLVDQLTLERSARDRFERQAIPLLERIALALERGAIPGSVLTPADEVRAAIDEQKWNQAQAILATLGSQEPPHPEFESLTIELSQARDRAVADLTSRIDAARQTNDAPGGLAARDELAKILDAAALQTVDQSMITWLMKLIQRRLRSIPIGGDLAALAAEVAKRFGGTPEGASLRAALPTLRRSAGLCPRCAEPYLGVDEACPKCLALAGQTPAPAPTLTFVTDELDAVVSDAPPVDLNNAEIWQLP